MKNPIITFNAHALVFDDVEIGWFFITPDNRLYIKSDTTRAIDIYESAVEAFDGDAIAIPVETDIVITALCGEVD